jgi:hypothetical protein
VLRKCTLAGHKRAGPKAKCRSVLNLRKSPLGSANMVAKKKKEKKKIEKKER